MAIFLIMDLRGKTGADEDRPEGNGSTPGAWLVPAAVLGFGTFAYVTRLTRLLDARG